LEQLLGKAVVIDISKVALENRDYQVSVQDFTNWESVHGTIPEDAIILLHTGFGQYWPDRLKYLGTDKTGKQALADLRFPGLSHE
jgi:kynurenine formamidase